MASGWTSNGQGVPVTAEPMTFTGWFNYVDVVGAHRYYTSEYAKVITQLKENPDAKVSLNLEDKLNG